MKIMFIAGEVSGDMRGAEVIEALKKLDPNIECFGIGGTHMQEAGCEIIFSAKKLAVMGLFEILKSFFTIRRAWQMAEDALKNEKPHLLVLIDYPGFNLRFAKRAKKYGVKILYYISPKIWAWKASRMQQIQRYVDHMAVIFAFEQTLFEQARVPVTYVGNPLIDQLHPLPKAEARAQLQLPAEGRVVALVPGSRRSELTRLMPVMITSAALLKEKIPGLQFILPIADNFNENEIKPFLNDNVAIRLIKGQTPLVLNAADLIIGASGTVTLEAAILGTPMVIIYKTDWLTFFIGRRVVKIPFIGLPNILAGRRILPELIQDAADTQNITRAALNFLNNDHNKMTAALSDLKTLRAQLGEPGVAERMARLIVRLAG